MIDASLDKDSIMNIVDNALSEIESYTDLLVTARQIATKRMVDEAEALGADAIINIRYGSSSLMQSAAEVIAYGTAVKYK